jgi:hypothetical protein
MSELFVSFDFFYIRCIPLLLLIIWFIPTWRSFTTAVLFTCNRIMLVYGLAILMLWYDWVMFFANQPKPSGVYPVSGFQLLVMTLRLLQAILPLLTISPRIARSWSFTIIYWLLLCWLPIYNLVTIGQTGSRIDLPGDPIQWMAYIAFFAVSYTVFWWMKVLPFQKKQNV